MAARNNKKSKTEPPAQPDNKPEHVSAWRTPAGIAAILGALATLITAIVGVYNVVGKNSSPPTPTPTPTPIEIAALPISFCDGYFEGWVFDAQVGTPTEIDLKDYDKVTVKLLAGGKLIGSIRYIPGISTVFIADGSCSELQPPTIILPDTDNGFDFEAYAVTYKSNSTDNNFSVDFKNK